MKYWYPVAPYGADIDHRRTSGTPATGAQPQNPIGGCAPRAGDPDVGGRRIVLDDRSGDPVLPRLHQPVATAVSRQPVGGAPPAILRVDAHRPDPGDGGSRTGEDPASAAGRQHPLEYPQAWAPAEDSP